MGISKKALFISLGAVGGVAAIAGGGLLVVRLSDQGNTYGSETTTTKVKMYSFRNQSYTADQLADFLTFNDYKVDARSKNGFMNDSNGGIYSFFKDSGTYTRQPNNTPYKIMPNDFWLTDAKGTVFHDPMTKINSLSSFNPYLFTITTRIFVNGEEYSYREFDGSLTPPIGSQFAPQQHLFSNDDVEAGNASAVEFKETNEMIYNRLLKLWYSNDDKYVAANLPNWSATSLNDLTGFKDNDEISIDLQTYIVNNNSAHLKTDPNVLLDLSKTKVKWKDNSLNAYFTSAGGFLSGIPTQYLVTTPSELYSKMLEEEKNSNNVDFRNIMIDGKKYLMFDYIPKFDKRLEFSDPIEGPGWFKVSTPPDLSTKLNQLEYYVPNKLLDSGAQKKPGQKVLYKTKEEIVAAYNLVPIDSKFVYAIKNNSTFELIEELKDVSPSISFPSDESAPEPAIYIDNERVFVSVVETIKP